MRFGPFLCERARLGIVHAFWISPVLMGEEPAIAPGLILFLCNFTMATKPHDGAAEEELLGWREVHAELVAAVISERETIAGLKAQKRYWLEEISANLTEDGKLTNSSVWKKPTPLKKAIKKSIGKKELKKTVGTKRKKEASIDSKTSKKARKKKSGEEEKKPTTAPAKSKVQKVKVRVEKANPKVEQLQGDDGRSSVDSYSAVHQKHGPQSSVHQQSQPPPHWGPSHHNFPMMAAVAFGSNPPVPGYPAMVHQQPPPQGYPQYYRPPSANPSHAYPLHRTYASIQDAADEESDEDPF